MAEKKEVKEKVVKEETKKVKEIEKAKISFSTKKVAIVCICIVAVILGALYINKWHQVKEKEKLMNSYLMTTGTINLEIKNLDEVSYYKTEAPNSYFVLISFTNNEGTYALEKGLKSIIDNYKLNDDFYYLNVEKMLQEDNYLTRLNSAFDTDKITTVPIILYYENGEIVDTVTRIDKNMINAGDFQKLLDIHNF